MTFEQCTCRAQELPALVAAWHSRIRPVLSDAVNHGRCIAQPQLVLSAKLLTGITKNEPSSFDPRYRELSHHLSECPFACPDDRLALALLSRA